MATRPHSISLRLSCIFIHQRVSNTKYEEIGDYAWPPNFDIQRGLICNFLSSIKVHENVR